MPTVRQVIIAAWATLPEHVREYGPFRNRSRPEEPSSSAIKRILIELLRDLRPYEYDHRKRFAAGHWGYPWDPLSSPSVSADGVEQIRKILRDSANDLSATKSWHEALLAKHKQDPATKGDKREALLLPSLKLARQHGAFQQGSHQHLVEAAISHGNSKWHEVRNYLESNSDSLQNQLDQSWASRPEHVPVAVQYLDDARTAFLDAAFNAAGKWSDPQWGDPSWGDTHVLAKANRILAEVASTADETRCPVVDGLSRAAQPKQPLLLGVQTRYKALPPLDRSVAARLYAAFKVEPPAAVTADSDGDESNPTSSRPLPGLVSQAIRASTSPLGLASSDSRALVLLMDRLIKHVMWQPKGIPQAPDNTRKLAADQLAYGFDRYFFDEWQKRGDQFFAKSLRRGTPSKRRSSDESEEASDAYEEQQGLTLGSQSAILGNQMNAVFENPRWLFMSAIWGRAFRLDLADDLSQDANSAWSLLRRAFDSVYRDALTLAAARAKRGEEVFGDPYSDSPTPSPILVQRTSTARDEVLRFATRKHGGPSLLSFVGDLRTPTDTAQTAWNAWVEEHARSTHRASLDEYSTFDQVLTHLKAPMKPSLDDVTEVLFHARNNGSSVTALKGLTERMRARTATAEDSENWERWRGERAAGIATLPVTDLVNALEQLPTFEIACELIAGSRDRSR